jgi:hypothetical protein
MVNINEPTEVLSMRLPMSKAAAFKKLAADAGREPSEQLEFLAIEALIMAGLLPQKEVEVHRLRESLVRRFLETAEGIYAETPRTDITAEAARQVMKDADWVRDYDKYKGLRDLRTIHPTFGRRVKLRLKLHTGKAYAVPKPNILGHSSYLLPAADEAHAG